MFFRFYQNNPYIMVMVNDGTKKFHHQTDGRDQQIAGCLKDFRNKPFPVKAKLEYWKNVITVRGKCERRGTGGRMEGK